MSDELHDEVEAINSIYGDNTLTPSDNSSNSPSSASTYILKLPGDASSLRLQFPDSYPQQPPVVLGTHHSSGGRKGAGARDLGLFRDALGAVFQEGAVCVFDAVEEFARLREEELQEQDEETEPAAEQDVGGGPDGQQSKEAEDEVDKAADLESLPAPPWTVSAPIVDNKSTFVAHVARVTSPAQARLYVAQLLASDRRIRDATHNMTAWRIRGGSGGAAVSYQDCDDDGEAAAGGRLLHLMQLMDIWDAMVVVTRWYGGVKLGPRRFAVINAAARDGFVRAGLVVEKEKEKKRAR
ncbi:Protein IMPACT-like protein [Hapsidospora chrysogenum ATCC 11550]|uniref:Protein IMPACT-like protein n=1 Tax=Hapsidospora chrysogenum (strain ATCC 11550 / CBS 779.69 / DSM 880 / IAM 14645 / JCM 23072 / IMI 49137) TaxID=857340 RepID=A0A086TBC6_HAPC1|nr:Protein IMPACT-like protein [Hapsidospora chrysogenum ATCC 11550]